MNNNIDASKPATDVLQNNIGFLFSQLMDACILCDDQGVICSMNNKAATMLKSNPVDLIQKPLHKLFLNEKLQYFSSFKRMLALKRTIFMCYCGPERLKLSQYYSLEIHKAEFGDYYFVMIKIAGQGSYVFLQHVVDHLPGMVFLKNRSGSYIVFNKSFSEFYGLKAYNNPHQGIIEANVPSDVRSQMRLIDQKLWDRELTSSTDHFEIPDSDGVNHYLLLNKKYVYLNGEAYILGSTMDITKQHQVEQESIQKQRFLEFSMNMANELVKYPSAKIEIGIQSVVEGMGRFFEADRSYIFQFNDDMSLTSNTFEWCQEGVLSVKKDLQDIPTCEMKWWMERLQKDKKIIINHIELLDESASYEKAYLEQQQIKSLIVLPLLFGDQIIGFAGFDFVRPQRTFKSALIPLFRLISNLLAGSIMRIKYGKALNDSEAMNMAIVQAIPDMIFVVDKDGVYLDFRSGGYAQPAIPVDTFIGKPISSFFSSDVANVFLEIINKALISKKVETHEYEFFIDNDIRTYEIRFIAIDEIRVLAIVRDISNIKELLTDLSNARDDAEAASMAKSSFLANISHELRTPLTTLLGYTEILDAHLVNPVNKKHLGYIQKSAHVLFQLISDLLEKSAIDAGRILINKNKEVSVYQLLLELMPSFDVLIPDNKTININYNLDQCMGKMIFLDEIRLRQIVTNLVSNSIKYTSEGSVGIFVKCEKSKKPGHLVDLEIKVTDTGRGIAPEQMGLIFEAFEQIPDENGQREQGAGLGLSIIRQIIDMMGGDINVESIPGKGSTFTVQLYGLKYTENTNNQPVRLKNTEKQDDNDDIEDFSENNAKKRFQTLKFDKKKSAKFTSLLQDDLLNDWSNAQINNDIEEIIAFGHKIVAEGESLDLEELVVYGKNLLFYSEDYDIRNIKKHLRSYPELIRKLSSDTYDENRRL